MSNFNIQDRLVRFGELIPCKTAFIDAHTPGSNLKEILQLLVQEFLKILINTFILKYLMVLILELLANLPNVIIHFTATGQLKYSLFYLANGDFFGELMVMLVKLFLKKEIYLIFLQVFLEVLKI